MASPCRSEPRVNNTIAALEAPVDVTLSLLERSCVVPDALVHELAGIAALLEQDYQRFKRVEVKKALTRLKNMGIS